jgi:hypothetical protein
MGGARVSIATLRSRRAWRGELDRLLDIVARLHLVARTYRAGASAAAWRFEFLGYSLGPY